MNKYPLLLIAFIGLISAQPPSSISFTRLSPLPYHVGDTIRFCSICSQGMPSESLFISTNLFSPPPKTAPVIFSGSTKFVITNPDTSWKFLIIISSEHCDTISFIAYYAPFDLDSLFFIKIKMASLKTTGEKFNINVNSSEAITAKSVHKTILKQSYPSYYINLLGRKIEMRNQYYKLSKQGTIENRYFEIILSKELP